MTRKEFILTLCKKYILPISIALIIFYIGNSFYNESNKLGQIQDLLKFSGFIIVAIVIIGCIRLLFDTYKFLNYVFYGIIITYLIYLIFNGNFNLKKDITIIGFLLIIEIYKQVIKKLDKIKTNT